MFTLYILIAGAFLAIVIGGIVLLNQSDKQIKNLNLLNTELENTLTDRDSVVNEIISVLDTIENSLNSVNSKRGHLLLDNSETQPSQKEKVLSDIRIIDQILEENVRKIEELEKKLKSSGIQLSSFKNKIAGLNRTIKQHNKKISEFKLLINSQTEQLAVASQENNYLQSQVVAYQDSLSSQVEIIQQKEEMIIRQTSKINRGFYASGTFKELFENGVIEKEGGFLGIGKNKILRDNLNEDYFTSVDITENRTILLNAKKINFISEHPIDSYKLVEENGFITKLEIEVPEDFWKISHYAVIEVKL